MPDTQTLCHPRRVLEGNNLLRALEGRNCLIEPELCVVAGRLLTGAKALHGAGMAHMNLQPRNCGLMRAGDLSSTTIFGFASWKPTSGECCAV